MDVALVLKSLFMLQGIFSVEDTYGWLALKIKERHRNISPENWFLEVIYFRDFPCGKRISPFELAFNIAKHKKTMFQYAFSQNL